MSSDKTFLYVKIPVNLEELIEELSASKAGGGLEKDDLIKNAKEYFQQQVNADHPSCEIMALSVPLPGNEYRTVGLYSSDLPAELLIKMGAALNIQDYHQGKTPLLWAYEALKGTFSHSFGGPPIKVWYVIYMSELLIRNGADLNVKDSTNGKTPLHWSCEWGNLEISKNLLIENGADPDANNVKARTGKTALDSACENGDFEISMLLMENGADPNAKYSKNGKTGANPNAKDSKNGKTPIHWACANGDFGMFRLLVQNGANVNAKAKTGKTPLHSACECGNEKISQLLIENGANLNAKANNGKTPLYWACWQGDLGVVQLLLNEEVKVNTKTTQGSTPLHVAAKRNHPEVVWLLASKYPRLVLQQNV